MIWRFLNTYNDSSPLTYAARRCSLDSIMWWKINIVYYRQFYLPLAVSVSIDSFTCHWQFQFQLTFTIGSFSFHRHLPLVNYHWSITIGQLPLVNYHWQFQFKIGIYHWQFHLYLYPNDAVRVNMLR